MKTTTTKSTKSTKISETDNEVIVEKIQKRAFQIYLNRGDIPGNAETDWLLAEQELNHTFK